MKIPNDIKPYANSTKLTLTLLASIFLTSCSSEPENPADIIITGGDILTMAGEQPQYVEAITIDEGKISFIGSKLEAEKLVGKATQKIDLLGATAIPAVVTGVQQSLTLQGATNEPNCWKQTTFDTSADFIAALKLAQAEREQLGIGLFCLGYEASANNALTDADLDSAFPETPVILVDKSLQIVHTNEIAKKKFTLDIYKILRNAIQKSDQQNNGLQVGQPADFMIIDKNPVKDKSASLASIKITQTFVQGKPVLDAPKDLAMLAILDIFSAYAEEKRAQDKIAEMNAATVDAANQERLKKEADEKAKASAKVKAKSDAKPVSKKTASKSASSPEVKAASAKPATDVAAQATVEKPKSARFNMTQDGKKMTAEDFDAWMKAQGIRIVPAKPAADPAPVQPAKTDGDN
jgi:hypothetical protein